MTKSEVAGRVAVRFHVPKRLTEAVVNILLRCIAEAMNVGDKVSLRGLGSFRV